MQSLILCFNIYFFNVYNIFRYFISHERKILIYSGSFLLWHFFMGDFKAKYRLENVSNISFSCLIHIICLDIWILFNYAELNGWNINKIMNSLSYKNIWLIDTFNMAEKEKWRKYDTWKILLNHKIDIQNVFVSLISVNVFSLCIQPLHCLTGNEENSLPKQILKMNLQFLSFTAISSKF